MNENPINPLGQGNQGSQGSPGAQGATAGQPAPGQLAGGFSSTAAPPKTTVPAEERSQLEEITQEVKAKSKQAYHEAKDSAQQSLQEARRAGRGFVRQRQTMLADLLAEYQHALHAATQTLEREDNRLASQSAKAAGQVARAADYLRRKQPEELVDDLSALVRRRPEVAFGSMFIAGLAAARFLKASARRQQRRQRDIRSSSVRHTGAGAPDAASAAPAGAFPVPAAAGGAVDLQDLVAASRPVQAPQPAPDLPQPPIYPQP